MPKFATQLARAKVEQLMQPALIRVIDNIRKQLDVSEWQGNYEEELIWPDGTTPEQQQEYAALQKVLHGVPPEEHDRVANLMSQLPQPRPLYTLRLTKADQPDHTIDIWALCYKVCATSFKGVVSQVADALPQGGSPENDMLLEADDSLFDEAGDVDWQVLDDKTKRLIETIFENFSASASA
ncbi:MAG: hypothetical protein AAFP03_18270 [Cyanobacteria bacterium J06598_3]